MTVPPSSPSTRRVTNADRRRARGRRSAAPRPFLFLLLDAASPLAGGARYVLDDVDEVVIGYGAARRAARTTTDGRTRLTLELPSPTRIVSRVHARLEREGDSWALEDARSTNGTFLNGEKVSRAVLAADDVFEVGHVFFSVAALDAPEAVQIVGDADLADAAAATPGICTLDPVFEGELAKLRAIAPSRIPITLVGERGVGKEVTSKAIHTLSRRTGDFVPVDCGAIPATLLESQLFGHVRGAFSGAIADHQGFLRTADGGTVLLDEILSATPQVQSALLRAIQEGRVVPVGGSRGHSVDLRFIAAAQRPLADAVSEGTFRADLMDRLAGLVFRIPPLRERRADIGLLVAHVLRKLGADDKSVPRIHPDVALLLLRLDWPGNIRQLEMAIQTGWALARDGRIATLAGAALRAAKPSSAGSAPADVKRALQDALRGARGNVADAARRMGKQRSLVYKWIARFGIDVDAFRD